MTRNMKSRLAIKFPTPMSSQGSRLTFQLASPVASDRFDPVAKTNFSLARHLNIHCRIKSSIKCSMALASQKIAVKTSELALSKNILFFQITDS